MEEPELCRRAVLCDQSSATATATATAAAASSSNLRELLSVRQEEDLQPLRRQVANLSLGTVLACEKRDFSQSTRGLPVMAPPPTAATTSSRTLLDIIRDDEFPGGGRSVYDGVIVGGSNGGHKISWRAFKERLRVRQPAADVSAAPLDRAPMAEFILPPPSAVSSSSETLAREASAVPGNNPSSAVSVAGETARRPAADTTPDLPIGASSAEEEGEGSNSAATASAMAAATGTAPPPQQIRVSLMTLLEQTDRQGEGSGFPVSALWEAEGDDEGKEDEEEEEGGASGDDGGKMYVKCCVCMVRHKGAAFIPCGHTFCRRCSRELWVSRGNCPLCNGFILEILDIF